MRLTGFPTASTSTAANLAFRWLLIGLAALLSAAGCGLPDRSEAVETVPEGYAPGELLATFYPTPDIVVERMFEMAALQPGELLYDLGSGDGKIVIRAVEAHQARAVGFEIDRALVRLSRRRIAEARLGDRARIVERDLLEADFSRPDVVTIFLTPEGVAPLAPVLAEALPPGARVVSYKFPLPNWEPAEALAFDDDDPETPLHRLYLYRR